MEKLFWFEGDRRRPVIEDLLISWDGVLRDLETAMETWDLPYVFGERPNLGILAVAATRIGHVPFEEYSAEKGRGKSRRTGRADLWLATKNGIREFDIEAKCIQVSFRSKRLSKTVRHHLDIAAQDASDILNKSDKTIGIVFISPYGARREDFDTSFFWDQLCDMSQYGGNFCALHICAPEILSRAPKCYEDRPGIAIVGRYIR